MAGEEVNQTFVHPINITALIPCALIVIGLSRHGNLTTIQFSSIADLFAPEQRLTFHRKLLLSLLHG